MRLAHARRGDLHELGVRPHLLDGAAAGVAHARAQPAHELQDDRGDRPLVRDAPLDALGHELVGVHLRVLEIAVARALLHRAERAHAAVGLVRAALEELDLAGRLLAAGEEAAQHHARGAGRDRLRHVARVADAAVGDAGDARLLERARDLLHRGDLRHAHARDDARGADGARSDADLHRVGAVVRHRLGRRARGDVAPDHLHLRVFLLHPLHAIEHALRVAVRRVHHDRVHAGLDEGLHALLGAFAHADRGAHAKAPELVLAGERVLRGLEDVLHGDEAAQLPVAVDHEDALEPVPVHEGLRVLEHRAFLHGHELVARRHDVLHRLVEVRLEPQVAVGDDADHALAFEHRKARDVVPSGDLEHLAHGHAGRDGDRLLHHAALEALDLQHLGGLLPRRHVLVHDADAAFLRERDGEARFGHRVHGGRQQRDVELDRAGEAGGEADFAGEDGRVGGNEQDVVESERLLDDAHKTLVAKRNYTDRPPPEQPSGRRLPPGTHLIDVRADSR
jgi:hypothetical protein